MPSVINEVGNRYGELVVVKKANRGKYPGAWWECRCDCGKTVSLNGHNLRRGYHTTCGHDKYVRVNHRLYWVWTGMRCRCNNKHARSYKNYGAKGIEVCKEWNDFDTFKKWAIENGYRDDLTIERIDVSKGYCPDNCKWITFAEQALNKTNTVYIEYKGEKHPICVWADKLGVSRYSVYSRKNRGWTDEEIIEIPYVRGYKRPK